MFSIHEAARKRACDKLEKVEALAKGLRTYFTGDISRPFAEYFGELPVQQVVFGQTKFLIEAFIAPIGQGIFKF